MSPGTLGTGAPPWTLADRFLTPAGLLGFGTYGVLASVPLLALRRADRRTRLVALALAATAVGVRLVALDTTPPGLFPDEPESLRTLQARGPMSVRRLLSQGTVQGITAFAQLPWHALYEATHSLLAVRIVGMFWTALVVMYAVAFGTRLWGLAGGAVAGSVLGFTPWAFWLSRHSAGMEIVLQELYLIAALVALAERPRWQPAIAAGLCVALLHHTYAAGMISLVFPPVVALLAPRAIRARALAYLPLVYVTAGIAALPHLLTGPADFWFSGLFTRPDPRAHDWAYMLGKYLRVLGSLVTTEYSANGSMALRGSQTLPPVVLTLVAAGLVASLRGSGPGLGALVLLGAVPCWVSPAPTGTSHRMMMMLAPLALLAGAAPRLAPATWRAGLAAGAVALVAMGGTSRWLSPAFWEPLRAHGMMQWALPLRATVEAELRHTPARNIRMHPADDGIRLVAQERGLPPRAFDFATPDYARAAPLVLLWRGLAGTTVAALQAAIAPPGRVETVDRFLTVLRLPAGFPGLLAGPPARGWSFRAVCADDAGPRAEELVVPFVFEAGSFPTTVNHPCRLLWAGRTTQPVARGVLVTEHVVRGTATVGTDTLQVRSDVTLLPPIPADTAVVIEVDADRRAVGVRLDDGHDLLLWTAVEPLDITAGRGDGAPGGPATDAR